MFPKKTIAFSSMLLLAACGGNAPSDPAEPSYEEHEHQHGVDDDHGTTASGLPAPLPMPGDLVQNQPPPGLAPADGTEAIALASAYSPLMSSTNHALPAWPEWWGTGKPVDGVNCLISAKYHKHSLISIYKDGVRLGFPTGIGRVHAGCYHAYEMHVHDVTGLVHMEADVTKTFKLGQWFTLWQQPLSRDNAAGLTGPVRFYIIEKGIITRYDGNPYDIVMAPYREVLIVTGTQMFVAPKYQWPLGI
jgi:hypothetical protein